MLLLMLAASIVCHGQKWEVGGAGGYGWYSNPTVSGADGLAEAGFPAKAAVGAVLGNNMYEYLGGELRWLFRFGGPQLKSDGLQFNINGHTNVIVYDLLIHVKPRDKRFRPFLAGGAGIKVFSGTGDNFISNPFSNLVRLSPHTQVEPAISAGGGVKYRITRHAQLRADFRTYFSPLPDRIFRRPFSVRTRGWVYDFVPLVGVSYVF
jgi:hypothetical protein